MTSKKQEDDAVRLFNPNDGVFKRDGGPYLDEVQARQAEEIRAYREGREPDFENLQPHPGVPLVSEEQLIRNAVSKADTSQVTLHNLKEVETPVYAKVPKEAIEATEPVEEAVQNDPALSNAGADGDPEKHVAPEQDFSFGDNVNSTPDAKASDTSAKAVAKNEEARK